MLTEFIGESELRCGIFTAYTNLFQQNESDACSLLYNLTVIPVAWGSYYRNVICIARSVGVGVGGNWAICYLKGCNNMSRQYLYEYFSLFCIWHHCNFHSKS